MWAEETLHSELREAVCRGDPRGQAPVRRRPEPRPGWVWREAKSGLFLRSSLGGPVLCEWVGPSF